MLLGATGCLEPSDEAKARLAATRADGEALLGRVDLLEERFLGAQANVQLWQELQRRHQRVTAIACDNQTQHYAEMVVHLDKLEKRSRELRRRQLAHVDDATLTRVAHRSKPHGDSAR